MSNSAKMTNPSIKTNITITELKILELRTVHIRSENLTRQTSREQLSDECREARGPHLPVAVVLDHLEARQAPYRGLRAADEMFFAADIVEEAR